MSHYTKTQSHRLNVNRFYYNDLWLFFCMTAQSETVFLYSNFLTLHHINLPMQYSAILDILSLFLNFAHLSQKHKIRVSYIHIFQTSYALSSKHTLCIQSTAYSNSKLLHGAYGQQAGQLRYVIEDIFSICIESPSAACTSTILQQLRCKRSIIP